MDTQKVLDGIAEAIKVAVDLAPGVIKTAADAKPFAEIIWNNLGGSGVVTQSDLDRIRIQIKALSAQMQAPLPPEQEDDV